MRSSAGPVMMAILSSLVIGAVATSLWAEFLARAISVMPDRIRMPMMEILDRADANGSKIASGILGEMSRRGDECPCCHRHTDSDELNYGKYRRCGRCATWGKYPGMPANEREIADNLEREYNRICNDEGAEAANKWLSELT